jgi:hypothetical protein
MAQDLAKKYIVCTLPTGAHQKIGGKPNSGCGLRACQIFGPASFGQEPNAPKMQNNFLPVFLLISLQESYPRFCLA